MANPALITNGPKDWPQTKTFILIVFVAAKIKEIFSLGRNYPWLKPEQCPRCKGRRLWGHGYVMAFFDGFNEPVWLRRYRCPVCGCVIRLKPKGYLRRFQASIEIIRCRLLYRLRHGRWPPDGPSRSRQGHWLHAFLSKVEAYLGKTWKGTWQEAFDHLVSRGLNPASRSMQCETVFYMA